MKMFHNPENKQINFLDERFYTVDGVTFYPSVTTVLDVYPKGFGFNNWLKDLGHNADDVLKKAGSEGSVVHDFIDRIINGETVSWEMVIAEVGNQKLDSFNIWMMILKFVEFWETYNPTVIANEFNIVSDQFRLGGTIDLVCEIGGERWLIDFKTSNSIHTTHELQMAAYSMMFNEKNPEMPIHRTGILWLKAATRGADAKGKTMQGKGWQIKEFGRHYTEAFNLFKYVRAIWDEENPNYKPKNLIYPDYILLEIKRLGEPEKVNAIEAPSIPMQQLPANPRPSVSLI